MVEVERRLYDGKSENDTAPSLLDGNLTTLIERVDGSGVGVNDRKTDYLYDYSNEGRLVETRWSTSLNQVGKRLTFVGSYVTEEQLLINPGTTGQSLREWTKQFYDSRGQVYETQTLAVDPTTGSTNPSTDFLKTRTWRNQRGDVVKVQENGGVLHKTQLDGLGRTQLSTVSWQVLAEDYTASTDLALTGDNVVSQSETLYDGGGNPIILKRLDRQPAYTGTGLLQHGASSQALGDYTVLWYDVEDRETHNLYYGDYNNANLISRPTPIPAGSDASQLQTKREYFRTGELSSVTDPQAIKTEFIYDKLGRLIEKIENTTDSSVWGSRRTEYTYTPTDQTRTISAATAINQSGVTTPQVTTYFYGVSPAQSPGGAGFTFITSNRLLQRIEYPQDDGHAEPPVSG